MMSLAVAFLLASALSTRVPPTSPAPGSVYAGAFSVPVVGEQRVSLKVLDAKRAHVQLRGVVDGAGTALYELTATGATFTLDDRLLGILRRCRCSVADVRYDPQRDVAELILDIHPLLLRKTLGMRRDHRCLAQR